MKHFVYLFSGVTALSACSDFKTASQLSKPQIIALRTEPAGVTPGERARLIALTAGPNGIIATDASWSLWSDANASIETDADESWLNIPDGADEQTVQLFAEVSLPENVLSGTKSVPVLGATHANPVIVDVIVEGEPVPVGQAIRLSADQVADLDVETVPPAGDGARVTWYATIGEIELYRRTPTELLAPVEAETGWLIVVFRDGNGGITWRSHPLIID